MVQLKIEAPLVANKALPGQFIILRVDENGERIPLTVAGVNKEEGTVKIIFQVVGSTTEKLSHKEAGEYIQDFVGPLGVATHLDGLKKVCIVGGGVGCAIAMPIAEKLHEMGAEVTSIIGFRNKDLLILEDEFKACSDTLRVMTDDGSYGEKGNVTMDAARTALRLGSEKVYVVYRRSMEELPARREEVEHAEEEGIEFKLLCNPTEILGYNNPDDARDAKNGFVTGMKCVKMELGEPDEKGRRRPVVIPDSEFEIEVDTVIMSIVTSPNSLIKSTTEGLEVNRWGGIVVNEDGLTSRNAVYTGGDAVTGAATIISAMVAGKTAAKAIDEYLNK